MKIGAVAVLARAPIAGATKTRMMPALSGDEAAALQEACIVTALHRFQSVETRTLWTAGEHTIWQHARDNGWAVVPQHDESLGRRMLRACAGPGVTVVVGTDSPDLPSELIEQAAAAVESGGFDVGFVPALDGGFCLLATRALPLASLDDVRWSASTTLAETSARLRDQGARVFCTSPWYDLDTVADLERLRVESLPVPPAKDGYVPHHVLSALRAYYARTNAT